MQKENLSASCPVI